MKDHSKETNYCIGALKAISTTSKHCFVALLLYLLISQESTDARPSDSKSQNNIATSRFLAIHKRSEDGKQETSSSQPNLKFRQVPLKKVTAAASSNVVLQCEAGGNPPPKIHWLKNGERISQSEDEFAVVDSSDERDVNSNGALGLSFTRSRLFLDCVQPQDTANYACIAENPFNRINFVTRLEVIPDAAPKDLDMVNGENSENSVSRCVSKKSYGLPARIHMWTHTRLELIGSSVQLYCRSGGSPQLVVSWTGPADDISINNSRKYQILENGDLVINDLRWDDMGSYTCHVHNQRSSDKVSTFLYPTLVCKYL